MVGALVAALLSVSASPALAAKPVPGLVPSAPLGPITSVGFEATTPVVDSTTHTMYALAATRNSFGEVVGGEIVEVNDLTGEIVGTLAPAPGVNVVSGYLALDGSAHTLYYASLNTVEAFNTATGVEAGLTQLPTGTIDGIAVDSATHDLLVASNTTTATLYELSGDLSSVVAQAPFPQRITSLAVDSVTGKAFVSEYWTAMAEVDLPALTVGVTTSTTQVDSLAID